MSENDKMTVRYSVDDNEVILTPQRVQEYIVGKDAGKITIPEYKMFTELCKVRKLNPFLKEAYCIKYGSNPAQIVVGKDAVLKRAIQSADFDGMESGVITQDAETGNISERRGTFFIRAEEKLVGGWAKVYRKNWTHATYCSVSFDEVAQHKSNGELNQNWAYKGATMVEKVAKVRALRETFVEQLGGMYEAEEMGVDLNNQTLSEPDIIKQEDPTEASAPQYAEARVVADDNELNINDL